MAEGKQGSAISVTVGVEDDLEFEKIILAYRPEGATEFLGREMKEVADGRYSAEIPSSATSGGTVAYYIEAEDADGAPIATRGSVDNPLVIHLLGVGVSHRTGDEDEDEDDDDDDDEGPDYRYFVGLMAGSGFGYAIGEGDTNRDVTSITGASPYPGCFQIAPEFGYWLNSGLMLSVQIRYEYITGTTDIHERSVTVPERRLQDRQLRPRGLREGDLEVWHRHQVPPVLFAGGGGRPHPARRQLPEHPAQAVRAQPRPDLHRHHRRRTGPVRSGWRHHVRHPRARVGRAAAQLGAGGSRLHRPPRRQRRHRGRVLVAPRRAATEPSSASGVVVRSVAHVAVIVFVELGVSVTPRKRSVLRTDPFHEYRVTADLGGRLAHLADHVPRVYPS